MNRKTLCAASLGAALLILPLISAGGPEPTNPAAAVLKSHIMLAPGDMKWEDGPDSLPPGAKIAVVEGDPKAANVLFTIRVKFPDGFKIAPHTHPADEHVTVISGTFHMGMGEKVDPSSGKAMPAGSFMVMPKGHAHYAWTSGGETIVQVHAIGPWAINYINPADDPRKAKAP